MLDPAPPQAGGGSSWFICSQHKRDYRKFPPPFSSSGGAFSEIFA
jgi:hypothetical protein